MVASGTVSTDQSSFAENLSSCTEAFTSLNSSWKGPSYKGIEASVEAFVGESQIITDQMEVLANICAKYEEYVVQLRIWKTANEAYNKAKSAYEHESRKKEEERNGTLLRELAEEMRRQVKIMEDAVIEMNKINGEAATARARFNDDSLQDVSFQSVNVPSV